MKVLVTGSEGFIGKNLVVRLKELDGFEVISFLRNDSDKSLEDKISISDAIIHLAGENRPKLDESFKEGNIDLTDRLCSLIGKKKSHIPLIFTSSAQANIENIYGKSKLAAENIIEKLSLDNGNPVFIYRLPGVFGKWCKPNYNSVVATFCNNIANDLPVKINDSNHLLRLVYIDDVISSFIKVLTGKFSHTIHRNEVSPEYNITLGDLFLTINEFKKSRSTLISEKVGSGLLRALYATYISYFSKESFMYPLISNEDERGVFVEMLKTKDSGQFSFFTAHPGITRGGHYHHTKSEKFMVVKGHARFCFRNIISNEFFSIKTSDKEPTIVETIPGWAHDITNEGDSEMIVLLWANEVFDKDNPDTIASEVHK
jgi:UDP-2-acetamido-2,6-beta-L-arabino-hexul-4-ose reductase